MRSPLLLTLLLAAIALPAATFREDFRPGSAKGTTAAGGIYDPGFTPGESCGVFRQHARLLHRNAPIQLARGRIECDLRLDFDAKAVLGDTKSPLRSQSILTLYRPDDSRFALYAILGDAPRLCAAVFDRNHRVLRYIDLKFPFEGNQFYHIAFEYGRQWSLKINDRASVPVPFDGLFGEVPPQPLRLLLGPNYSSALEVKYTMRRLQWESDAADRPRISIPTPAAPPPVIDGNPEEDFWNHCAAATGFAIWSNSAVPPTQPVLRLGAAEDGLYVSGRIPMPPGATPRADATGRDGSAYLDDAVELRFQPRPGAPFRVFIGNCAGGIFDSLEVPGKTDGNSTAFNPEWTFRATADAQGWQFEALLPWTALGGRPASGTAWRGNLSVDRAGSATAALGLFPAPKGFNDEQSFGDFLFTGTPHAVEINACHVADTPAFTLRKLGGRLPMATVSATLHDAKGRKIDQFDFRFSDTDTATYRFPALDAGDYRLAIKATDENRLPLLHQRLDLRLDPPLLGEIAILPYRRLLRATLRLGAIAKNAATASLRLRGAVGAVGEARRPVNGSRLDFELPLPDLAPGDYQADFTVFDRDGKALGTITRPWPLYPRPPWFDNRLGLDHSVPPPWEPIQVAQGAASVWNRVFTIGPRALPAQITNGGSPMFASPPQLLLTTSDGKTHDLAAIAATIREQHPDAVAWEGTATIHGLAATIRTRLEFDGCLRCDLTLAPPRGGATVQSLRLQLPAAPGWGGHLLAGTGVAQEPFVVSAPIRRAFTPMAWLGNTNGGLCLFFERDQHWTPAQKECFRLTPQPDGATLWEVRFLDADTRLDHTVEYTFGLMPTPVRPAETANPFALAKWEGGPAKYAYPEYITYRLPELAEHGGAIEFLLRRDPVHGLRRTELISFTAPGQAPLTVWFEADGRLALDHDGKRLAHGTAHPDWTLWNALAIDCRDDAIEIRANGQSILRHRFDGPRRKLIPNAFRTGALILGGTQAYAPNYNDLILDDLRILDHLAQTPLRHDPFEDAFRPDGFSTLTAAQGEPSPGARFVPGRVGNALALVSGPLRDDRERLRNEFHNEIQQFWCWHRDEPSPTGEYLWPPDFFHPARPSLLKRVEAARADGYRLLPYMAFPAIHYPSDLARQFAAEWQIEPVNIMPYGPPAGHCMLSVSPAAKGYADYLIAGILDTRRKYGFDGVYTDGLCGVHPTANPAHGAWRDDHGHCHAVWPFFASRETLKRLYRVVKSYGGFLVNHQSFAISIMNLSFSDAIYTGEHENYRLPETMMLRFNARPWGGRMILLGSSDHAWSALHQMSALLVGSGLWGHSITGRRDLARKTLRIQQAYEAFGTSRADFIPFYDFPKATGMRLPDGLRAAAYRDGNRWLLVVGNFNRAAATATIAFPNLAIRSARAALTGAPCALRDGAATATILPENFQLLEIVTAPR